MNGTVLGQDALNCPRDAHRPYRVLLAEDNPALAQVTRFNLERAGYEVTVAFDGREAWLAVQQESFDAVISDEQMPVMTGREFCTKMRELDAYRETPIVFLTAKSLELDHDRLQQELGVSHVVGKPFSPRRLVEVLTPLLGDGRPRESQSP